MFLTRILFGVLTTWCTIHAITVPVDRADVQLSPTRSSMIANGWRPLTGYENTGTNVSPSNIHDRNAPVHPVLGKFHEHMHAGSEKLKAQTKSPKPQEYSLPSILGSFGVLGHQVSKSRTKPKEHSKPLTSATTHYSFLVPPPRDSFRFEVDPHRKTILRDNEAYLRQPTFISQNHQTDINGSPFFSKGAGFSSSTTNPTNFPKNRPYLINGINNFGVQQNLHPPRHNQPQQFEAHKASNAKPYFQLPGLEHPQNFGNENKNLDQSNFGRFHNAQVLNGGGGNFYSQVDHPPPFKGSYERDPSFLVHESHEISYVTPSSEYNYNFRPSHPYDNGVPSNIYPSTTAPKVETSQFTSSQQGNRYNQFEMHNNNQQTQVLPIGLPAGTYYLQGEQRVSTSWPQQKSKFTTEINEVLPKKNSPAKFRPETSGSNPSLRPQSQIGKQPEIIFVQPSVQTNFNNPISSGQAQKTTSMEPEYETPESISLKHFNEQQFLLQQQLIQQDRKRLQEQELQRQREQQRKDKQEEENRKREEEIRLFEEREKEAEQKILEEQQKQRQQLQEEREQQQRQEQLELRKQQEAEEKAEQQRQQQLAREQERQERLRAQLEEQKKILEQQFAIEQKEYHRTAANQDRSPVQQIYQSSQESYKLSTIESDAKEPAENTRQEVHPENEPEVRPYRPKFPPRNSLRRRRPSTPGYSAQPTETPIQDFGTYHSLTDSPVQTTMEYEMTTVPVPVTTRPRLRRPGQPLKRRRLPTTTPTPQYESPSATAASSSIREPETNSRHQFGDTDSSKRRKPRPTQSTVVTEETVSERHYIRKRPSSHRQRVNPGEPFEAEVATEIVRPTRIIYKDTTEWENYPENFKKRDSQEVDTSSLPSQTLATQEADQIPTENTAQNFQFSTEPLALEDVTNYEEQIRNNRPTQFRDDQTNIPLEQLFDKPEENHIESVTTFEEIPKATTTTTTTSTTTTTTTEAPPTTTEITSTTRQSHRIRPLKYGNATRPRFSIKDYRSRIEYKNRLSQLSTTESTLPTSLSGRRRFTTERPDETSAGTAPKESTTSRYKYMSRVAYKPTTSSPTSGSLNTGENDEEEIAERVNRFKPKRKYNTNLYRSRVSGNNYQINKMSQEENRQSTTRPENIYSAAIRRPRPSYRNRNQPETTPAEEEATEMTAEETSFYSSMTTPKLEEDKENNETTKEIKKESEGVNEILKKDEIYGVENKVEETASTVKDLMEQTELNIMDVETPTRKIELENNQEKNDQGVADNNESISTKLSEWNEPNRDADDAFISQRIANLTSSASELYEPGMFKAVSPATESRVISSHFTMVTDEPTLPIEAFFQAWAKKDE